MVTLTSSNSSLATVRQRHRARRCHQRHVHSENAQRVEQHHRHDRRLRRRRVTVRYAHTVPLNCPSPTPPRKRGGTIKNKQRGKWAAKPPISLFAYFDLEISRPAKDNSPLSYTTKLLCRGAVSAWSRCYNRCAGTGVPLYRETGRPVLCRRIIHILLHKTHDDVRSSMCGAKKIDGYPREAYFGQAGERPGRCRCTHRS